MPVITKDLQATIAQSLEHRFQKLSDRNTGGICYFGDDGFFGTSAWVVGHFIAKVW